MCKGFLDKLSGKAVALASVDMDTRKYPDFCAII